MMHPSTELRFVNPQIGLGVFATAVIPKGTITYVEDEWEIEIAAGDAKLTDPLYAATIARYAHMIEDGSRVISWDIARYVNHCCQANTISTGYGFEIAVRDIAVGEEIRDEYGLFEFDWEMELICAEPNCRGRLRPTDIDHYADQWDELIRQALSQVLTVEQPLWGLLESETQTAVTHYLQTGVGYRSVTALKPAIVK